MTAPLSDTGLPVEASIPAIRDALADRGHAVAVAPPGSGKTTVVPLRLLGQSWLGGRRIVVLEPRRLATRAAARRMASLLGQEVGETVGYVTRDDRRVGPGTLIEVVTEGVLTRRLQRDPELPTTGLVVFDEVHERNLQTDLGLALALDARRVLRPDLRMLVMSATIDAGPVAALLGGGGPPAPVIRSEAQDYGVEIRWTPLPRRTRLENHVAGTVRRVLDTEPGDMLVFLPGIGEIDRVAGLLGDAPADVRRLHGSLPLSEQDAALVPSPPGHRKVVLSTDIAETSLTVEGVRVVIDGGLARAPRFDARTGMTRLRTVPISKASAEQRSGRAGRTQPGVAYRLWSKMEHAARRSHIDAEIGQVDLAGLALELAAWGTDDPATLPFLDPPPARSFTEARRLLELLGALDGEGRLTEAGRMMAELPLHPRLGRMVVEAGADQALACVVAALVDDRDLLRGRPDDVPVDLAIRVRLVTGEIERHPLAGRRSVDRARHRAADLARRAGVPPMPIDADRSGRVLALAFPDRLAVRRGSPGRFQLRTGTTAWVSSTDTLAGERFLVPADLDGKRKDARIRLAAPLDTDEVADRFAHEVEEGETLVWEGERLTMRRERRLGGLVLDQQERRPEPNPEVSAAIVERLRANRLDDLPWTDAALHLRHRIAFLRRRYGSDWPDWSTDALVERIDEWLLPVLDRPTGLDDLAGLDLVRVLRSGLGHPASSDLDRLAPTKLEVPSGRRVALDYSGETPVLAVRVQEMFGSTTTPKVAGVPVVLHLLSPAGRPVQITQDLAGFWSGSWEQVRKEMAGRYPKHVWPEDPSTAKPVRR